VARVDFYSVQPNVLVLIFFVTADYKYHEFFDAEGEIVIADTGHFESEQFTQELLYDIITKKFPNFATLTTEIDTNPIKYYS